MDLNLTIAIDDVNPKKGWRIFGDKTEKYLFDLNKEFGAKFTLFIPSNYHNEAPISENKEWINELNSTNIFELAAHGHFHQTSNKDKFGEMEFVDMTEDQCKERIKLLLNEWEAVDYKPLGWRNPGWMCQPYCVEHLSPHFKYAAVHYQHNHNLEWGCKMYFGADGIHQDNISIHNTNCIMFQSHIAGDWNDNVWNKDNYETLKYHLDYLINNYSIHFKTISEL